MTKKHIKYDMWGIFLSSLADEVCQTIDMIADHLCQIGSYVVLGNCKKTLYLSYLQAILRQIRMA